MTDEPAAVLLFVDWTGEQVTLDRVVDITLDQLLDDDDARRSAIRALFGWAYGVLEDDIIRRNAGTILADTFAEVTGDDEE